MIDNPSGKEVKKRHKEYDVGNKYTKSDNSKDSALEKKGGPKFTEYTRLNTVLKSNSDGNLRKTRMLDGLNH